jgi:hypothetical protein
MSEISDLETERDINVLLKELEHWQEAYLTLFQANENHSATAEQTLGLNQRVLEMSLRQIEIQAAEIERLTEIVRILRRNIQHMRREI